MAARMACVQSPADARMTAASGRGGAVAAAMECPTTPHTAPCASSIEAL